MYFKILQISSSSVLSIVRTGIIQPILVLIIVSGDGDREMNEIQITQFNHLAIIARDKSLHNLIHYNRQVEISTWIRRVC